MGTRSQQKRRVKAKIARSVIKTAAARHPLPIEDFVKKLRFRRKLKRWAAKIGLRYWPALYPIYNKKGKKEFVDPQIYLVAEKILHKKTKVYWDRRILSKWPHVGRNSIVKGSTGGWHRFRSKGELSNEDVFQMWLKSGRKINGKFAYQVSSGIIAGAKDSLPELKNYARGLRWIKERKLHHLPFHKKTITVLGKLSPELRNSAILELYRTNRRNRVLKLGHFNGPEEYIPNPIRVRHLDWTFVKERQEFLRGKPLRVRACLGSWKRMFHLAGGRHDFKIQIVTEFLSPSYPNIVNVQMAKQLCLGTTPVQLAAGLLSKSEAHEWLLDGAKKSIIQFLNWKIGLLWDLCVRKFFISKNQQVVYTAYPWHAQRSIKTIRWIEYILKSEKIEIFIKHRNDLIIRGHLNQKLSGYYWDYIDEVQDEDILTGKDSVHSVFEKIAERKKKELEISFLPLTDPPIWVKDLPKWIKHLNSKAELLEESKVMQHCVGSYVGAVEKNQCVILSIVTQHGKSTAEIIGAANPRTILQGITIAQHKSERNGPPPKRNHQLLVGFFNRLQRSWTLPL